MGLAAPHESQPGLLERGLVLRLTSKSFNDAWMRPDITPGELPGRANECTRDQAAHEAGKPPPLVGTGILTFAALAARYVEQLPRQSIMTRNSKRALRIW